MSFPLRSPNHKTSGVVFFARLVDKIRLQAAGQLPEGYHVGFMEGNRTFDDRFCTFFDVPWSALQARVLEGGTDEELLAWAFAHGRQPSAEQIEVWNTFLLKRGWNDSGTPSLIKSKAEAGLADHEDIVTFFQLMDVEEGRAG
jgi:gluconokinase